MPVENQPTVATGDTITASYNNTKRDNVNTLDARTGGDPGGAGKIAISNGTLGASWVAILTAILDALGYTPLDRSGSNTMNGALSISVNLNASSALHIYNQHANGFSIDAFNAAANAFDFLLTHSGLTLTVPLNGTTAAFSGQVGGGTVLGGILSLLQLSVGANGISAAGNISATAGNIAASNDVSGLTGTFAGLVQAGQFDGGNSASGDIAAHSLEIGLGGIATAAQIASSLQDSVTPPMTFHANQAGVVVPNLYATRAATADNATAIANGAVSTAAKIASGIITDAQVATANKDGATGTASMRTLGTGAAQAAAGNHGHANMAVIGTSSYAGNNAGSRVIANALGFTPKKVDFIIKNGGTVVGTATLYSTGDAVQHAISTGLASAAGTGTMDASGFTLTSSHLNISANTYTWVAFG